MWSWKSNQINSSQVRWAPEVRDRMLFGTLDILYNGKILQEKIFSCLNTHLAKVKKTDMLNSTLVLN